MPKCLLIADDLTGAADACAKFVAQGFSGEVLLSPTGEPADADARAAALDRDAMDVDVLALNTDTRRLTEAEARRRVRQTARYAVRQREAPPRETAPSEPPAIFKKIDSTLRGHVGAEIAEAMTAFACTHAIIAPAFPAMGRTVRDGCLFVAPPGDDDARHADRAKPTCDVPALLAAQGLPAAVVIRTAPAPAPAPAPTDDAPDRTIAPAIADAIGTGATTLVCDALTQADLATIVTAATHAIAAAGGRPMWIGSAGLAQALAAHLSTPAPRPRPKTPRGAHRRPALLVIGSPHAVTRAQLAQLLRERDVVMIDGNKASAAQTLQDALRRQRHVLVPIDSSREDAARPPMAGWWPAIAKTPIAGFVMSGGDTAADVCVAMGADRLHLRGEVANGIAWGILRGGDADGVPLVLKSGGFGRPDALIAAVDFLSTLDPNLDLNADAEADAETDTDAHA